MRRKRFWIVALVLALVLTWAVDGLRDATHTVAAEQVTFPFNPVEVVRQAQSQSGDLKHSMSVTYTIMLPVVLKSRDLKYGMSVTSVRDYPSGDVGPSTSLQMVRDAGFGYIMHYASWAELEPSQGQFNWNNLNDVLRQAEHYGLKVVLRIYYPPAWARPVGSTETAPPMDNIYLYNFMNALVAQYGTRFAGYVIWNEPNLTQEWGGQTPNAAAYVDLLRAAYQGAKAANSYATIVSAGLAPTVGEPGAVNDLTFLQQMYDAGLKNYCDVVGMNGIGFAYSPDDTSDPDGLNFSRLALLRQVMVNNADDAKQAWALEVGWLRDTDEDLGGYNWMKVSERHQAEYLVRAFQKAEEEWPWMDLMFVWNLDFNRYYPETSHMHWFAIGDFSAVFPYSISGRITDDSSNPISNVTRVHL